MRSLLLHAHPEPAFDARLQVALDLARAFDAHLTLLQVLALDVTVPGDYFGAVSAELEPILREEAEAFQARTEAQLANEDVPWDWVSEAGMADSRMLQASALADLAIIGAHDPAGGAKDVSPLAGELAVHSRAPIMVVPDDATGIALDRPAMVCWNGSAEASHALRAALPLLKRASAVHLVTVQGAAAEDSAELPPVAGAQYLARHGVECEMVELPRNGGKIDAILRDAARARGAGFMVMGAYGHARLIETLFGGVTRSLLSDPPLPLVLAH